MKRLYHFTKEIGRKINEFESQESRVPDYGQVVQFLGFSIKGSMISFSPNRLKTFQKEIESRTIRKRGITLKKAVDSVNRYYIKAMENIVGRLRPFQYVMFGLILMN